MYTISLFLQDIPIMLTDTKYTTLYMEPEDHRHSLSQMQQVVMLLQAVSDNMSMEALQVQEVVIVVK